MLRFALFTALTLAIAAAVIVALVRHGYAVQGQQRAIERARLTTAVALQAQLRPSDLEGQVSVTRRHQLDRLFRARVIANGTLGAALYTAGGAPTYSTGRNSSADKAEIRRLVRQALAGSTVATIDRERSGSGRVLSIYLPVTIGSSGANGVLAVEQDYAPIASATRHSTLLIAGVLEGVLLALFLLLMPMLARASARIRDQLDALDRLATHDELTGLANRAGFRRSLEQLARDTEAPAGVLLVDIESFHEINDTVGAERGDTLLAKVGARLDALDDAVLVARMGEDEFGLLLPGASSERADDAGKRGCTRCWRIQSTIEARSGSPSRHALPPRRSRRTRELRRPAPPRRPRPLGRRAEAGTARSSTTSDHDARTSRRLDHRG